MDEKRDLPFLASPLPSSSRLHQPVFTVKYCLPTRSTASTLCIAENRAVKSSRNIKCATRWSRFQCFSSGSWLGKPKTLPATLLQEIKKNI